MRSYPNETERAGKAPNTQNADRRFNPLSGTAARPIRIFDSLRLLGLGWGLDMTRPATRREFLKATAVTAAAMATAGPAAAQAKARFGRHTENTSDLRLPEASSKWRLGGPKKEVVRLDKPHVVTPDSPYLNSSGEIANKRFVLDPTRIGKTGFPTGTLGKPFGLRYPLSAFGLLTLPPGAKNIRIVDCEFEGPWRSIDEIPDLAPGPPKFLKGIDMQYASDIRIEGCSFDHLPSSAIYFYGCSGVEIEDVWSRNCTHLVNADWIGVRRNRYARLDRLHHADGWGAADLTKNPTYASVYARGRSVGANAVVGWFADSEISNLTTSGEVKSSLKLVNPVRVNLDRIYSSSLMIQGSFYWNHSDDPTQGNGKLGAYNHANFDEQLGDHAVDVMVTRSRFRGDQNAWLPSHGYVNIQLSYHQEKIRFRDCVFYKPDQTGPTREAIQAWDGVEVDVRDSLFLGWEKPVGPLAPFPKQKIVHLGTYQKPGSLPVSINADFLRVNGFRHSKGPRGA